MSSCEALRRREVDDRCHRPRVALLLALALLVPLTALAALTGSSAVKSRTQHEISARVERDATELGALMQARALVADEYVPSSALTAAAQFKITPAQVKRIFRIDYPAVLHNARKPVDANAALRSDPTLVADLTSCTSCAPRSTAGRATPRPSGPSSRSSRSTSTTFGARISRPCGATSSS